LILSVARVRYYRREQTPRFPVPGYPPHRAHG